MSVEEIIIWIAKVGAAIGSIIIIVTNFNKLILFIRDLSALSESIKRIEAELKYNGGSTIKDIASKIESRQAMQEHRLCYLLDGNLDVGIFETDETGSCIRVNTGYTILAGKTSEECLGNGWVSNIHHEDRDLVLKEWTSSVQQARPFYCKYRFTNDGKPINVSCKASPVFSKGKIIAWIGIIIREPSQRNLPL